MWYKHIASHYKKENKVEYQTIRLLASMFLL